MQRDAAGLLGGGNSLSSKMKNQRISNELEDSQREAISFAGVIHEAQGPITTFLIVAFIVSIVWAVVYLMLYL